MNRRHFLKGTGLLAAATSGVLHGEPESASVPGPATRRQWLGLIEKTAGPVLIALSQRRLKQLMPVECKLGQEASRRQCTYLEALGRSLSGIAPWLESGAETELRQHYCELAREAIAAGVDPSSPDAMPFGAIAQTLVDAAFLGLGLLRAPHELCDALPAATKAQLIEGLKKTRSIQPPVSNWLLFAATVEAALERLGADWDHAPVEVALARHKQWYVGDGVYGDGPHFHADYYDSFVIHPFLLAVLASPVGKVGVGPELVAVEPERSRRYAAIQERMIARDGTWPVNGRSITYRCGAFHLLADRALHGQLPEAVQPAQVRGALTAAMQASLGAKGSFDAKGWLAIGLAGHQPSLGETYISTGSLYLCLNAFLPLGLSPQHEFWSAPATPWTAQKAWVGEDLQADHAIDV